jgi:hypothetical protein
MEHGAKYALKEGSTITIEGWGATVLAWKLKRLAAGLRAGSWLGAGLMAMLLGVGAGAPTANEAARAAAEPVARQSVAAHDLRCLLGLHPTPLDRHCLLHLGHSAHSRPAGVQKKKRKLIPTSGRAGAPRAGYRLIEISSATGVEASAPPAPTRASAYATMFSRTMRMLT